MEGYIFIIKVFKTSKTVAGFLKKTVATGSKERNTGRGVAGCSLE